VYIGLVNILKPTSPPIAAVKMSIPIANRMTSPNATIIQRIKALVSTFSKRRPDHPKYCAITVSGSVRSSDVLTLLTRGSLIPPPKKGRPKLNRIN